MDAGRWKEGSRAPPPFFSSSPPRAEPRHLAHTRSLATAPAVSKKMEVRGAHTSSADTPHVRLGGGVVRRAREEGGKRAQAERGKAERGAHQWWGQRKTV